MTDPDSVEFRDSPRGQRPFASLGRRELALGLAGVAVLLGLFVGLAVLLHDNRSAEPEFFGGGAFLAWTEQGRPPPSFNVVDGRPEVSISALGADYFVPPVDPANVIPVNTAAGTYFVDLPSGHARSFDRGYRVRGLSSTTSSGGQSLPMTADGPAAVAGAVGDSLFVLSQSADARVTLRTTTPDLAEFDQLDGQVALEGSLTDTPAVATTSDAVWVAVADTASNEEGPRPRQLYRIGVGPEVDVDLASVAASEGGVGDGEAAGSEIRQFDAELQSTDLPSDVVLTTILGRDWVATASVERSSVVFHLPDGTTRETQVPELADVEEVIALRGGDAAWFLIQARRGNEGDGEWRIMAVSPDDLGRRVGTLPDSTGLALEAGAVLGDRIVSVDETSGRVVVVDARRLGELPDLPVRLYDYRSADPVAGQSSPGLPLASASVEPFANRVFVNSASESFAIMVRPAPQGDEGQVGGEVVLLRKDSVQEVTLPGEDALELPPPPIPLPPDGATDSGVTTSLCEPDSGEDRTPVLLPQSGPSDPRSIDVAWSYPEATTAFCSPVAEVILSQDGREVRRELLPGTASNLVRLDGLETNSEYEVVVEAIYNFGNADEEFRRRSSPEVFRTAELGPCPVEALAGEVTERGWQVTWAPPAPRGSDCEGRVVGYEVRVFGLEQAGQPVTRTSEPAYVLDFDPSNIGLGLRFTVVAVGLGSRLSESRSFPSAAGDALVGQRAPNCSAIASLFGPQSGSGESPEFGVLYAGNIGPREYADYFGTRDEITVTSSGDVVIERAVSPDSAAEPFGLLAADAGKAGLRWSTDVTVRTPGGPCDPISFSGSNDKLNCVVGVGDFDSTVAAIGETTSAGWTVTVSETATLKACVSGWTVSLHPDLLAQASGCGLRRPDNVSFVVSNECSSTPRFLVSPSVDPLGIYTIPEESPIPIDPLVSEYELPVPVKQKVTVTCTWQSEDQRWSCDGQEVEPGKPFEWRRNLLDGPFWNQKDLAQGDVQVLIESCSLIAVDESETSSESLGTPWLFPVDNGVNKVGCLWRATPSAP